MWLPSGDCACDWKGAIHETHQYTNTYWVCLLLMTLLFWKHFPSWSMESLSFAHQVKVPVVFYSYRKYNVKTSNQKNKPLSSQARSVPAVS